MTSKNGRARTQTGSRRKASTPRVASRMITRAVQPVLQPSATALKTATNTYSTMATDMALAGFEAQRVIALRCAKLARGGRPALEEVRHMISEKVLAFSEGMTAMAFGGSPRSVVRRFHSIMQANTRRLTR